MAWKKRLQTDESVRWTSYSRHILRIEADIAVHISKGYPAEESKYVADTSRGMTGMIEMATKISIFSANIAIVIPSPSLRHLQYPNTHPALDVTVVAECHAHHLVELWSLMSRHCYTRLSGYSSLRSHAF